jgi:outer membrane protein assembly factor BamB
VKVSWNRLDEMDSRTAGLGRPINNASGVISGTASGMIFAGARDGKVRAIDSDTGKVLWEAEVNAALERMPAIYEVEGLSNLRPTGWNSL